MASLCDHYIPDTSNKEQDSDESAGHIPLLIMWMLFDTVAPNKLHASEHMESYTKTPGHAFRNRAGAVTEASGAQEGREAVHMSRTACGSQTCVDGRARTRRRAHLSNKRCRSGDMARPTQDPTAEAAQTCSGAALPRAGPRSIVEIHMIKMLMLPCGRARKDGKLQHAKYRHLDV